MDIAYDHVQEEALSPSGEQSERTQSAQSGANLNAEFQQAFQAVSSTPWGATLGGWFNQARKQGEGLVADLQKEAQDAQREATQGWSSLREQVVQRTRGLSSGAEAGPAAKDAVAGGEAVPEKTTTSAAQAEAEALDRPESLPADIVKEAGTLVASLRLTAASKLKDLQTAEDAADEALLKFGTNLRNFLRDAVTISAPTDADSSKPKGTDAVGNEVLFETQEAGTGKKVFHTTRLDAQLHAIHTAPSSFTEDSQGPEWETWKTGFDAEKETDAIARDLDRYEDLRRAMEQLVPEKVDYKTFWLRYYFLRKAIEEEEKRRKEVLKGATANPAEEVTWDDDDEEEAESTTPNAAQAESLKPSNDSSTTLNAPAVKDDLLKPAEPRRSHEDDKSVAGSDASYDVVSGTTSRAPGSPKEEKKEVGKEEVGKEESDGDDDWE